MTQSEASVPAWVERAWARRGEPHFAEAGGVPLHYLAWRLEHRERPGLLFVHGYRAHAHYWDAIAPYFADSHRVVAMDLAGMGDSGHRAQYGAYGFAADIAAVIAHAGLGPAVVVGHSFGGARALRAALEFPDLIKHVVAVDSICRFADSPSSKQAPPRRPRLEPYPDYASARARYRLAPGQPCDHPYLVDYIARHSLREQDGGWLWKFDPLLPPGPHEPDMAEVLRQLRVPVDYVRGEFSTVVRQHEAERIVACLPRGRGPIVVPQAYHYLMLDQPLALIAVLRVLLA
ncbi:MAG: alpha/beta hydrolase [Pigmentiphaga sp.]|uniref:alpha/beta fold hydrolase n=1 Tax=Pigmentiphaga sp. TaxID=1977564 RepID=UPI0029B29630|nr:alpha/beta hydrolase [Pigmentiphaga sp.]MDX3906733.1 alpha/beta hydrolase [Pigmentiphaga sp.]